MKIDLTGKTALVTGGNSGIGRAISIVLAQSGADVALTYFSTKRGEETARAIRAAGRRACSLYMDGTDSASVSDAITRAAAEFDGHIDILVNNAGHLIGRVPIAEMDDEHWHKVINVNLSSAFYCARSILPYMNTGWGRIINMSSLAAHNGGGPGATAYSTAKAGLLGLTRGLAKEYAPRGITANAVAPGLILGTPFHDTFNTDEGKKKAIAGIPLQRGGTPEEVASTVVYLASEQAGFITGEVIEFNGGAWFR
ncbi:MAG: SDR family oxidoreductase [Chloroflexi bacterium AL-W]|nr:SDR family oxidoreductase [Chloroflexi bacterium AL-N1]NOK66656.1 SDR family oxidoreductase [Chloroflexi bacterium AL-N10]NOK72044.1 SDR family oxidoreductase [Chloroflexi bacterium AL-N5]NOK81301.1 SDR family oxidoreductase [Chloroflexi bacterium AL-W]NOK89574.1 SDR family oxidoreductase [Chloroflexi bacterium AL-N15]